MAVCFMIEVSKLSKSFGKQIVLSDISFQIPDGQIIGLSGKSGIGKTTLSRILCGILPPDRGNIFRNGIALWEKQSYKRSQGLAIQMVNQHPFASLDPRQKIIDGFTELIRYHHFAVSGEAAEALIKTLITNVGLPMDILRQLPHQISGGEAQRVVIARCLLFQPELLILDEATSMLDVSTQANIIGLVKRMQIEQGRSVLLISHARDLVEAICDHIYVIENTKIR
jgi:peptide/nickel transport system ATP-binding protein